MVVILDADSEDRSALMFDQYVSGMTLEEIGQAHNVTRARIEQILKAAGHQLRTRQEAGAMRRMKSETTARLRQGEILQLWKSGAVAREIAPTLGLSVKATQKIIQEAEVESPRLASEARKRFGNNKKTYRDDELITCLLAASQDLGGVLSTADYRAYVSGRHFPDGRPWPGPQTVFNRFGSWVNGLHAAGLRANPSSPIAGKRIFEEAHCLDAVRHVKRELRKVPSAGDYESMARRSGGGLPSLATVRNRCGGWTAALQKAGF